MADNLITVGLISSYGLHIGGVETHLLSLMRYCDPARYRFVLVGPISPELSAQAEALGAQVVQWKTKRVTHLSAVFKLRRILRENRIDIAHFHCPRAAFMARPLTRLLGIPTVVTVQLPPYYFTGNGYINTSWGSWLYKKCERILNYWFTDKLIYASFQVMEEARAMGLVRNENTVFIGNGVNLGQYNRENPRAELRQQFGVADHERLFCCVGRLDQQKGLDVLIEAFSWLNPRKKQAKLWFVGDGPLRDSLQKLTKREGLDEWVSFLGFRRDIPEILQSADAFVLPSRFEAMPLSIIEAMATGLPCIVSDTGENSLMVEDGVNGFIVPIEDVKALSEAMEKLAEDNLLCKMMGKASREKSGHYSEDITVRRIQQIYESFTPPDQMPSSNS